MNYYFSYLISYLKSNNWTQSSLPLSVNRNNLMQDLESFLNWFDFDILFTKDEE